MHSSPAILALALTLPLLAAACEPPAEGEPTEAVADDDAAAPPPGDDHAEPGPPGEVPQGPHIIVANEINDVVVAITGDDGTTVGINERPVVVNIQVPGGESAFFLRLLLRDTIDGVPVEVFLDSPGLPPPVPGDVDWAHGLVAERLGRVPGVSGLSVDRGSTPPRLVLTTDTDARAKKLATVLRDAVAGHPLVIEKSD